MTETALLPHAVRLVLDEAADADVLNPCGWGRVTIEGRPTKDLPTIGVKAGQLLWLNVSDDPAGIASAATVLTDLSVAAKLKHLVTLKLLTLFSNGTSFEEYTFAATISVPPGEELAVATKLFGTIKTGVKRVEQEKDFVGPSVLVTTLDVPGAITLYGACDTFELFDEFQKDVLFGAVTEAGIDPAGIDFCELDDFSAVASDPCEYVATA
ncbi:MAG TPA: hypothetical protein VLG40_01295 [Candidatus Saccharimonas sp.]|nr:hypothetical protein [Candidatus Saccharimonas sp.]